MRRRSFLAAGIVVSFLFVLSVSLADAQVRLRYAHVGSEGDIQYWYGEAAAKKIAEVTNGRVTATVFPN